MSVQLNRRDFIKSAAVTAGVVALAACRPSPTPAPTVKEPTAPPEEKAAEPAAPAVVDTDCQMDWNPTFPASPKVYDPPIECAVIWEGDYDFPSPEYDRFNNPMYNRTLENTYIRYTMHWVGYGDVRTQKFATDMAAGTLADQFHAGGTVLEQLIAEDMLFDIKDIWEATASPLVKEKKQYPGFKWWRPVDRDGKLWGVPFTWGPAYNVDNLCFIRQDWLDQLGLSMPATLEEWGDTARAFREAGLCEFGINACRNLVTWYQSLDPIFGAFGGMPTCWVPDGAGGLRFDTLNPTNKQALAVIRDWYAEGLIDPDFYTYGEGDSAGHIAGEKIGIFTAPWWHGGGQATLERENPGWKFAIMPYPQGPGGLVGRKASGAVQTNVCFRKGVSPELVEAHINNLNWHMEMHVNWLQYQQYGEWRNSHAFAEGFEWVFDEDCEIEKGPIDNTYIYMNAIDFGFPYGIYPDYQYDVFADMAPWFDKDPAELNKAERFLTKNPAVAKEVEYYSGVFETLDTQIVDEYFGNPTDRMVQLLPDLNTLYAEVFTNIVIGNEPLDRFDSFVEEWLDMGGDEVTQDVSAWYRETFG